MSERTKILIVDDEAGFARLLKMNLEDTGLFEVKVELSGEKGLKAARQFRPDVILMDLTMGDMSGEQVAAVIKADADLKKIPIIFVTATPPEGEAGMAHAVACIQKPASAMEIIECVRAHTVKKGENEMP